MNAWSIITLHSPTPSILWRWTLQLLMRHHLAIITHGVFIDARRRQKPQSNSHSCCFLLLLPVKVVLDLKHHVVRGRRSRDEISDQHHWLVFDLKHTNLIFTKKSTTFLSLRILSPPLKSRFFARPFLQTTL